MESCVRPVFDDVLFFKYIIPSHRVYHITQRNFTQHIYVNKNKKTFLYFITGQNNTIFFYLDDCRIGDLICQEKIYHCYYLKFKDFKFKTGTFSSFNFYT